MCNLLSRDRPSYISAQDIYYSGHDVPLEGEHKILQHIRKQRSMKSYQPNQRHCMYGQDADLIMLGLATHEPHFTILREVIDFTRKPLKTPLDDMLLADMLADTTGSTAAPPKAFDASKPAFQLLHLSVLREYIEVEFCHMHRGPQLDRERLVDDFVFLTFLVGNDFIPHIPSMDIGENAFDIIFDGYKSLQTKGPVGYIVNNGEIGDFDRLEKLFAIIGRKEEIVLRKRDVDSKKRMMRMQANAVADMQASPDYTVELTGGQLVDRDEDMGGLDMDSDDLLGGEEGDDLEEFSEDEEGYEVSAGGEQEDEHDLYSQEAIDFDGTEVGIASPVYSRVSYDAVTTTSGHSSQDFGQYIPTLDPGTSLSNIIDTGRISLENSTQDKNFNYRDHHYKVKFGVEPKSSEQQAIVQKITEEYLKGLMWCLSYYFKGCVSWSWYYPYYYGPTLIDMNNLFLKAAMVRFSLDQPFTPNQQLLGCLPPISVAILPKPYRPLMTSPDSPIIDYYPRAFVEDMDGKRNHWEAVILLKFIDSLRLKEAEKELKCLEQLTPEEAARNKFGSVYFHHVSKDSTIEGATKIPYSIAPQPPFRSALVNGTMIPYHGFPSLRALPIQNVSMRMLKSTSAFGGRYKTLILGVGNKLCEVGSLSPEQLVGRQVFVNYPMMREAKVVGVSTADKRYHVHEEGTPVNMHVGARVREVEHSMDEKNAWMEETDRVKRQLLMGTMNVGTAGMEIQGRIRTRLFVTPVVGTRVDEATGKVEKVYSEKVLDVPMQMVKWKSPVVTRVKRKLEKRPLEKSLPPVPREIKDRLSLAAGESRKNSTMTGSKGRRKAPAVPATAVRSFSTTIPRLYRPLLFGGASVSRIGVQNVQVMGLRTVMFMSRKFKF
jgi:5'-3' exoribonuclease 1